MMTNLHREHLDLLSLSVSSFQGGRVYSSLLQGSYTVRKNLEFDFSYFQAWVNMWKESMEKYVCFQSFAPILFPKI